jgi:hypothetical protein
MGTLERRETITHRLGSSGRISVKTVTGLLRIRGVAGEDATVTVDYRIRAADQASAERALDTGRVAIDRGNGSLEIETPERRLSTGLAWLFGGARVSADITVEVPWGTQVRLETMSGTIEAHNLVGEQKYRTVSGDIRAWSLGGTVETGTISGGISLDAGTDLRFRGTTISGGIRARAGTFRALKLNTTSGGITVIGALDPLGDHRADSISGSVDLTPLSGVTTELRTVSGSIHSETGFNAEGSRGYWRAVVGDGRATLRVNTTSGSLRLRALGPAPRPVDPAPAPAAPEPVAPEAEPVAADAAPLEADGAASPVLDQSTETWDPSDSADETIDEAGEPGEGAGEDEMVILQALERGEIDVDEAADRLEQARSGNVR